MHPLKRLMVGLDLTEMDDHLIRYAAFLSEQPSIERVIFMHIEKSIELPEDLVRSFAQPYEPTEEAVRKLIEEKVTVHFEKLPHVQVEVNVVEGTLVREILSWSKEEQVDLIILGRKKHLRGSGILPEKVLRNGKVSVLFVTEHAELVLDKIMVSIDFSDYAMMALEQLLHSALNKPVVKFICLHVYEVPTSYMTLGKSYNEFDEQVRSYAHQRFEQVLARFPDLQSRTEFKLVRQDVDDDIGELIVEEAKKAEADLLVIGAKGKSAAALFIMGSVTEKVLRYNDTVPLMVFKRKNEELGFLDALLHVDE